MYKIRIQAETDGDFSFKIPLFHNIQEEQDIFYESRNDAIKDLKLIYSDMVKTITTGKRFTYIKDLIVKFHPYLTMLCDNAGTFTINLYFGGDRKIEISLILCDIMTSEHEGKRYIVKNICSKYFQITDDFDSLYNRSDFVEN